MLRARFAVAAAVVIIAAPVVAFLLRTQPVVVGTNLVAALEPVARLYEDGRYCQPVPEIPEGLESVRISAHSAEPVQRLRLEISTREHPPTVGKAVGVSEGSVRMKLEPPPAPGGPAEACVTNLGSERVTLHGERDPDLAFPRRLATQNLDEPKGEFALTFIDGRKSWADRFGTIQDRFGYSQLGAVGGWALWGGLGLALVGLVLGVWVQARCGTGARPDKEER